MSKLAHSNQETMDKIERDAANRRDEPIESPYMTKDELLRQYDEAVKTVNLKDGPKPGGKSEDFLAGQTRGITQGLKIARSIIEQINL